MGGLGRACGKLLLFGEHAAVYGHPAVGVSLSESLTVRLHGERTQVWDLGRVDAGDRDRVRAVLALLEERMPGFSAAGPCSVLIDSTVPRGLGFGSSAALCAGMALAALEHTGASGESGADSPRRAAWLCAHEAECLFHGTPSGVDTGLSLLGGLLAFLPRPPGLPEVEELPDAGLCLVTGAVPRDAACGALIAGLGARLHAGEPVARNAIDTLGGIAKQAGDVLRTGETHANAAALIGSLADQAMEVLRRLGLSTPALDELLHLGRKAGAVGGKLSGAGGGGAFYLVAPDAAAAASLADALGAAASRQGIPLVTSARPVLLR